MLHFHFEKYNFFFVCDMETSCLLVRICWTVTWRLAELEFYPSESLAKVWSDRRSVWWSLMYFTYTLFLHSLLGKTNVNKYALRTFIFTTDILLTLLLLAGSFSHFSSSLLSTSQHRTFCRRYVHTRSFSFLFSPVVVYSAKF